VGSLFLYSERQGRCVELKVPEASSSDLAQLHGSLPNNVTGLSLSKPEVKASENGKVRYHSISTPNHVSEHLKTLGEKLLGAAQPLAALNFFDLAYRISFDSSLPLKRAEALLALGRIEEANREVQEILRSRPPNAFALFLGGRIALYQEKYSEALRYFSQAREACAPMEGLEEVATCYIYFTEIFRDRDQLHTRNLAPQDYAVEIEQLRARVLALKTQTQKSSHPQVRGMEVHLDALENLFSSWLRELSTSSA